MYINISNYAKLLVYHKILNATESFTYTLQAVCSSQNVYTSIEKRKKSSFLEMKS